MRQRELLHPFSFSILKAMMREPFSLPAFAKINWKLDILGKRDDGYHELCTIFQTVSLSDTIRFAESDELSLTSDSLHVPLDERNLIIKVAKELQQLSGDSKGAAIHLEKNIPSPGGLGGGSADAAVALLGLIELWGLDIGFDELIRICARTGSDVPYFLYGGTALGTGRGTEIEALPEIEEKYMAIVTPQIDVKTADAFARLGALRLTKEEAKSNLGVCHKEAKELNLRQSDLNNDFEKVVFEIEPEIKRVKESLLEAGASMAQMSGSGSSVFGIFENEKARQSAIETLEAESNWRLFPVKTISRFEYREFLKPCDRLLSKVL